MMGRTLPALAAIIWAVLAPPVSADSGREGGSATVTVVQSGDILLPRSILAPASVYPLGKQNYPVVARMLDRAVASALGADRAQDAWGGLVSQTDRVGILLDAETPPASLAVLDALVDRLVRAGVRPANIIIWSRSEQALFSAGLVVRKSPEGINTMGADSEGYLGGLSRIVLGYCDVLINLARLRPDDRIGMWGAVANQLASVPEAERARLMAAQDELPAAAARPSAKVKFRLHVLDALQPNYEPGPLRMPPYWVGGKLLASTDCVALDVVGRQLLERKREQVRGLPWPLEPEPQYLQAAAAGFRLGQADPERIYVLRHDLDE